jgi:hypothetical protein
LWGRYVKKEEWNEGFFKILLPVKNYLTPEGYDQKEI